MKKSKKNTKADYIGYLFCILIIIGIFKATDYYTDTNDVVIGSTEARVSPVVRAFSDDDLTEGIRKGIREEKILKDKEAVKRKEKHDKKLRSKDMEALVYCQTLVEKSLKSPATADMPFAQPIVDTENSIFTVHSYVDAQNSYGAILRTNYACMLKYVPELAVPWQVVRLEFLN